MAIKLPQILSKDSVFNRYQILLQQALQSILNFPTVDSVLIQSVSLIAANNPTSIPTGLSGPLTGWYLTRIKAEATIWDSNTTSSTTLLLNTSADVVVDIVVF